MKNTLNFSSFFPSISELNSLTVTLLFAQYYIQNNKKISVMIKPNIALNLDLVEILIDSWWKSVHLVSAQFTNILFCWTSEMLQSFLISSKYNDYSILLYW